MSIKRAKSNVFFCVLKAHYEHVACWKAEQNVYPSKISLQKSENESQLLGSITTTETLIEIL